MTRDDEAEPRAWLLLGLCLLIVACVYVRVLEGPFLWDDRQLIVDADSVHKTDLLRAFSQPFWLGAAGKAGSLAYYRPLTSLSFMLDYALHGDNSSGFHLTNLLLHLLATGFVFALLRRRGTSVKLAFLLCCAWALLPRLTEGAAWVSGRGDLLASVFSLAALWVHRPGSLRRLLMAAALGFAALLCKESGLAVLLGLWLLERAPASPADTSRRKPMLLAVPIVAYAALRISAGAVSLGDGVKLGGFGRVLASLEALGRYALMLLDPFQPRSLMGQLGRLDWRFVLFGGLVLACLFAASPRFRKLEPETRALVVVGLLPLALVLHLTALPLTVVAADRYLYLPTAALLLAAAPALQRLLAVRRAYTVGLLAFVIAAGMRSFERVGDYTDDARFFAVAARASPNDGTALIELGSVAFRAGLFAQGLELTLRAVPLDFVGTGQALDNAALMATASGDRRLAAQLGEQLLARYPGRAAYELRRAAIALNARDFDGADRHARRASELAPDFARARDFLPLIERARSVAARPDAPPALAQAVDIEAARYPEVTSRLNELMTAAEPEQPTVRTGVELMIAMGEPQPAQLLFERYRRRFGDADTQRMSTALALRLETAASVRHELAALAAAR